MGKNSTESEDIRRLKRELEKRLNWGSGSEWHSSMFTELGDQIFEKCGVMLSQATLKRFWGVVNHDGTPSTNTLDTLSQFLDFANWREFRQASSQKKKFRLPSNIPGKSVYVTLGFFAALFMILIIGNKRVEDPEVLAAIPFSSRPVTNTYPNSVVFDFDLGNVRSDSLFIQQYWDPTKTIKLKPGQKQATGIYYFPGYFRAKLLIDGVTVKEHDLFLRSDGWVGTLDYQPVPKYFSPESVNSGLVSPDDLTRETTNLDEPIFTTFHYISDLGNVSGDDFILNTSIRINWSDKWAVCQTSYIYIIGTDGAMIIPFSKPGCTSDIGLMLNEEYYSGKEHDLSAFGTDLSDFRDIELKVRDKKVTIAIENSTVYEGEYSETMGRFVGMRYKFLGVGEVDNISVLDQTGSRVLQIL